MGSLDSLGIRTLSHWFITKLYKYSRFIRVCLALKGGSIFLLKYNFKLVSIKPIFKDVS